MMVSNISSYSNSLIQLAALRMEWCRSRARAMRWSEEVVLLQEEMRRVGEYLNWQAMWWRDRCRLHKDLSPADQEGMEAYAHRQASLHCHLKIQFADKWTGILKKAQVSKRHPEVAQL